MVFYGTEARLPLALPDIESAMCKCRRLSLPALPTSCSEVDEVISNSRYAEFDSESFYRGTVDANIDGMATLERHQPLDGAARWPGHQPAGIYRSAQRKDVLVLLGFKLTGSGLRILHAASD